MSATTPRLRTKRSAKEVLPRLLAEHDPPISRNKLSRLLDISVAHVSRACSPNHRDRFSGEALARIAALLGLPEDYFLETRCAEIAHRVEEDPAVCDILYDLLTTIGTEDACDMVAAPVRDGSETPSTRERVHPLPITTPLATRHRDKRVVFALGS